MDHVLLLTTCSILITHIVCYRSINRIDELMLSICRCEVEQKSTAQGKGVEWFIGTGFWLNQLVHSDMYISNMNIGKIYWSTRVTVGWGVDTLRYICQVKSLFGKQTRPLPILVPGYVIYTYNDYAWYNQAVLRIRIRSDPGFLGHPDPDPLSTNII